MLRIKMGLKSPWPARKEHGDDDDDRGARISSAIDTYPLAGPRKIKILRNFVLGFYRLHFMSCTQHPPGFLEHSCWTVYGGDYGRQVFEIRM